MVAPGDNLEFQASGAFRDQAKLAPEIVDAAKEALRRNPRSLRWLCGEFWDMQLRIGDADLVFLIRRRKNTISFLAVFDHGAQSEIVAKRRALCKKASQIQLR